MLYGSNNFLLSEFLYCKLGLDGYCSFVPYTIYERPIHGSMRLIISFTPHGIILWVVGKKPSGFIELQLCFANLQKHVKREYEQNGPFLSPQVQALMAQNKIPVVLSANVNA